MRQGRIDRGDAGGCRAPSRETSTFSTDPVLVSGSGIEADYAFHLLRTLGNPAVQVKGDPTPHPAIAWARSGAMMLTGFADRPALMCPAPLASCAAGVVRALEALAPGAFAIDATALLGERAAFTGLSRNGAISPGGMCRLLEAKDGMLAVNLPRGTDWELLPAWLEEDCPLDWDALAARIATKSRDELVARGRLLGLAVASETPPVLRPWYRLCTDGLSRPPPKRGPLVIDLSALWAGPLAAHFLLRAGARVIKVESSRRPDGARSGVPAFFNLLNGGKENCILDFDSERGKLLALIAQADIIVEASRPRALKQLGLDAEALVKSRPGLIWVSISGYGRREPGANWIALGDDAAIAAGLSYIMREASGTSVFCADAVADPLTGVHAALAALGFYRQGRGGLIALALRDVVTHCAVFGAPVEGWRARAQAWTTHLNQSDQRVMRPRSRDTGTGGFQSACDGVTRSMPARCRRSQRNSRC
jgi:hypothetical protein